MYVSAPEENTDQLSLGSTSELTHSEIVAPRRTLAGWLRSVVPAAILSAGLLFAAPTSQAAAPPAGSNWQTTTDLPALDALTGDVFQIMTGKSVLGIKPDAAGNSGWQGLTKGPNLAQEWFIVPAGDQVTWKGETHEKYFIISRYNGRVLGIEAVGNLTPIALLALKRGDYGQLWVFMPQEDGTFRIQNSGKGGGFTGGNAMDNVFTNQTTGSPITLRKSAVYEMPACELGNDKADRTALEKMKITVHNGVVVYPDKNTVFSKTFTYLPAHMVQDVKMSAKDQYLYTPFYKLQKETLLYEVATWDNTGSTSDAHPDYHYNSGISKSEMTSRTKAIEISATIGTGDASPVKAELTASWSMAFTTESSSSSSSEQSKGGGYDIPGGKAGGLYTVRYRFSVLRLHDGRTVGEWEVAGPSNLKTIVGPE